PARFALPGRRGRCSADSRTGDRGPTRRARPRRGREAMARVRDEGPPAAPGRAHGCRPACARSVAFADPVGCGRGLNGCMSEIVSWWCSRRGRSCEGVIEWRTFEKLPFPCFAVLFLTCRHDPPTRVVVGG